MRDDETPGLFHFSEESDIARFEPRPSDFTDEPVVWAIHEAFEHQYLFPRGCPRVMYTSLPDSDPAAVDRYLADGSAHTVVAIEAAWLGRMQRTRLYRYTMPRGMFAPQDQYEGAEIARTWVSTEAVDPVRVDAIDDLLGALARKGVEIRILPSLWSLRDRILASGLPFSFIRMRNAQPRP
ncbi:hypothetical protein HN371_19880 [Candidatus Poribacteria bacterium]|jgi:hypothetical protein|nr:hypothetical protein [Candidatus Poribacteria bacterium]MBT5537086.1 hypothetical protein [Candidatus Poribacteria bacterium]MBT5710761.1 hypothetical protein [Candidatus Poribacteria bacterium]MBT7096337.1 hypothetical protein [Candidatus Poribacteria bacterium]MBT7804552.1 hypothetical protein [Candidatus Poribacteria bacterium]